MKIISIFISCLFTLSCASYNAGQDRSSEFIKKPILQRSLISGEKLSEEAIKITLNSKLMLPQKIRLAVAYLQNPTDTSMGYRHNAHSDWVNNLDEEVVQIMYLTLKESKKISRVIPVPNSFLEEQVDIDKMRSLAARLQADILLVIDLRTSVNWDFKIIQAATFAKGVTSGDAFLIDTKTGTIPNVGTYTDVVEIKKDKDKDYDLNEALKRVKLESEKKVISAIVQDVLNFLDPQM